jgi:hypothetical protein
LQTFQKGHHLYNFSTYGALSLYGMRMDSDTTHHTFHLDCPGQKKSALEITKDLIFVHRVQRTYCTSKIKVTVDSICPYQQYCQSSSMVSIGFMMQTAFELMAPLREI